MPEKTVAEKTRIKRGVTVALIDEVPGIVAALGLPDDAQFVTPSEADLVFLFAPDHKALEAGMREAVAGLAAGATLWVFFRKGGKAAGVDVNRDAIWAIADGLGLRPLGLVSVDATWSAFRLRPAREV